MFSTKLLSLIFFFFLIISTQAQETPFNTFAVNLERAPLIENLGEFNFPEGVSEFTLTPNGTFITSDYDAEKNRSSLQLINFSGEISFETTFDSLEIQQVSSTRNLPQLLVHLTDGDSHQLQVIELASGQVVRSIDSLEQVDEIAQSDNGILIATTAGEAIQVWDLPNFTLFREFSASATISQIAFSPNRELMATADTSGTLTIWNLPDDEEILRLELDRKIHKIEFFDDDTLAIASENAYLDFHDIATGEVTSQFIGHIGAVRDFAFSQNGEILVSVAEDGSLRLWNVENQTQIIRHVRHLAPISDLVFANDDAWILTRDESGEILLWGVRPCGIVATNSVNIRLGPSTRFDILEQASQNLLFNVTGQSTDQDNVVWWRLQSGNWVNSEVVNSFGDCSDVPIIRLPAFRR